MPRSAAATAAGDRRRCRGSCSARRRRDADASADRRAVARGHRARAVGDRVAQLGRLEHLDVLAELQQRVLRVRAPTRSGTVVVGPAVGVRLGTSARVARRAAIVPTRNSSSPPGGDSRTVAVSR